MLSSDLYECKRSWQPLADDDSSHTLAQLEQEEQRRRGEEQARPICVYIQQRVCFLSNRHEWIEFRSKNHLEQKVNRSNELDVYHIAIDIDMSTYPSELVHCSVDDYRVDSMNIKDIQSTSTDPPSLLTTDEHRSLRERKQFRAVKKKRRRKILPEDSQQLMRKDDRSNKMITVDDIRSQRTINNDEQLLNEIISLRSDDT